MYGSLGGENYEDFGGYFIFLRGLQISFSEYFLIINIA